MITANKKRLTVLIAVILAFSIGFSFFVSLSGASAAGDKSIVSRGDSEYKIVLPAQAESAEKSAASELQLFFEKATDIKLPIVSDEGLSAGGKYFSIGKTAFLPTEVKNSVQGLKSCGYAIKTVDNTIYIIGPTANGTLYGAYGYLSREFGFEYYFTDVYTLNRGIGDLELKNYDVKVDPDIDMMITPNVGFIQNNSTNKLRFNAFTTADCFIPAEGTTQTHNLWHILPKSEYETHPEWFSADPGSDRSTATACFTAHGNADEYAAMQDYFLDVIKAGAKISSATIFQIAQPDNCDFCTCAACRSASASYGGASVIVIKFCNDLCAKVYEWFGTDEGAPYARDFKLVFLAYQNIAAAPVGDIRCDENVGVYLAFDGFKSSYGLHEDKQNEDLYNIVVNWSKKTDIFLFWIYDVNFDMYLYPYDTSAYKQDFYRLMKQVGTIVFNDLSQHQNNECATAWNNVKSYITCKLRWNVDANVEVLVKDFFKNCYKDAWEIMYNVYTECKAHWAVLKYKVENGIIEDKDDLRSIFGDLNQKKFWGLTMLRSWVSQFKDAIKAIEPLKQTDKAAYDKAYKMICAELISPMSMIIEMYKAEFSERDFSALVEEFKSYVLDSGVGYYADGMGSPMSVLYETLHI